MLGVILARALILGMRYGSVISSSIVEYRTRAQCSHFAVITMGISAQMMIGDRVHSSIV